MYILQNGEVAVGPFETLEDAENYRNQHSKYKDFLTMEMLVISYFRTDEETLMDLMSGALQMP